MKTPLARIHHPRHPLGPLGPRGRAGRHGRAAARPRLRPVQRGVVLLLGLIALAIMLIGAAAMARSMTTAMFNAGNIGFKRDMTNQAERAAAAVVASMSTGGALAGVATREGHVTASNYSATILATNAQGLPLALLNDSNFATVGQSSNDIAVTAQALTLRYVIDRLCTATGAASPERCAMANDPNPPGCSGSECNSASNASSGGESAISSRVVYRVSIRVTGPRGTQSFFQTTFAL
jgi:hypothetical protein